MFTTLATPLATPLAIALFTMDDWYVIEFLVGKHGW